MALGNNYETFNNNQESIKSPNIQGLKFNNSTSTVDKTSLKFDFWNNLLKISIAPMKTTQSPDGFPVFDFENAISVHLTHIKARILYNEIIALEQNPDYGNVGISLRNGMLLSVSTGKEFGTDRYCIVIRNIDDNTGKAISTYVYETQPNTDIIRSYSEQDVQGFSKAVYENIELDQIKSILEEYYKAATGAIAANVAYSLRYDIMKTRKNLGAIAQKLGVDTNSSYGTRYNNSSYFNRESGNAYDSNSPMMNTGIDDFE